ncbi:putative HTH-type transcriptional regulator [Baekduia alba]|uniref:winged helix-turn-helix transcriptional regulator n=1 Tax=Baekduia alba TaxID=2997333 RepID=UPI002341A60B|nr:helix-turn-helix domain-containing protein [Baekduia alba]WCB95484.1 putative HTH-type transcriptional regulator [Baekduia alba]
MPKGNHTPTQPPRDAVELAMDVLSDRWTFLILREAFFGVRRYGQMQRNLGIARNVLADRLRQLVADGMFERVRYRTDPDWYEYRLTDRALDLYPVIIGLMRWADQHLRADQEDVLALELVHRSCGAPADPYLACSHCHEPLTGRDIDARVRAGAG